MTERAAANHRHGHEETDWAVRGQELLRDGEINAPMVDRALAWVAECVPGARDVLDIGSGPGVAACAIADLLPAAQVLATDGAAPLLAMAKARASQLGLGGRVTTREVSLPDGLHDLPQADIVWVSNVVHHLPDAAGALRALGALVRPGGVLAVREGGLPIRFLPEGAAPGLLPRLEAVWEDTADGAAHPEGIVLNRSSWPTLLREAGLHQVGSRSFLLDLAAPVSSEVRQWLCLRLERLRGAVGDRMSAADSATLSRLLDPEAPDGVLRRSDVHLLTATTVHIAKA
jgi:SAM-dependent methyltransferase